MIWQNRLDKFMATYETVEMNIWNIYNLKNVKRQRAELIIPSHALRGSRSPTLASGQWFWKSSALVPSDRSSLLLNLLWKESWRRKVSHAAVQETGNSNVYLGVEIPALAACLASPRPARPRPAPAGGGGIARVWHALVRFLTSQIKWNNSHHISQANDLWNFNIVLLVLSTITHHRVYWLNEPSP
jgi:hypothetical protein